MSRYTVKTGGSASGGMIGFGAIRVEIDFDEIQGLRTDSNWRMIDEFTKTGSELIANAVAGKARWLLDPDNPKRNIGVTGRASRNIFVRQVSHNKKGRTTHEVYEGVYPVNAIIRMGRGTMGKRPHHRDIVEWIVHKGIHIKPPEGQKRWRMTKYGGPDANLRSRPPRPFKADLRGAAIAIATKINELGLAHLEEFYPLGKPKYDYYGELLKNKRWLRRMLSKHFDIWAKVYVTFLKSGQYRRVPVRTIEALRRD